jgi:hypothetical protein
MSHLKNNIMKKFTTILLGLIALVLIFVSCEKDPVEEPEEIKKVLIIYDDTITNVNSMALKSAIEAAGFEVDFSEVSEATWDNTNPSLTGYYGVLHMNGTTYGSIMPAAGQSALVDFVINEGGYYVQAEWDGYQIDAGQMLTMRDITLLDRGNSSETSLTYAVVAEQENHAVLIDIPGSFTIADASVNGTAHVFAVSPSVVLMKEGDRDAVVVREYGNGKILGFHHAGNYDAQTTWSEINIQNIVINFFKWESL